MRTTRLVLATAVAGLLTLFSVSTAHAVDYSEPVVNVGGGSGADGVVAPGEEFTLNGDFGGTECDPWNAEFEGQTASGSGTTYSLSFTAPTEPGTYFVNISCTYEDAAELSASGVKGFSPFAATVDLQPIEITVEGADTGAGGADSGSDSDDNGALPDTGGSNLLLVAGGAALVVAGAGLVAARRRNS